jgi:hypothetical protein
MASAHVAGAVALMYSAACPSFILAHRAQPDSTSLVIKDYLLRGTDILQDLDGLTVSGGRLNLFNSMSAFYNDYCVSCMEVSAQATNVLCHGDSSGSIAVSVSAGTPPYDFAWSTGDASSQISSLPRGKYSVKISDAGGCVKDAYFEITQPQPLTVHLLIDSAELYSITAYVAGGTPPYAFLWNDAGQSTGSALTNLPAGQYSVTVTDAHLCTSAVSATLGNPSSVSRGEVSGGIKVYPSPLNDLVRIEIPSNAIAEIMILDLSGKVLVQQKKFTNEFFLDLSVLPRSIYFLKITSGQLSCVQKIVK